MRLVSSFSGTSFRRGAGAVLILLLASSSTLAEVAYRQVSATDLLQGYLATNDSIEVEGHAWAAAEGVFLNFNRASAQYPARLEIGDLDPDRRNRLLAQCAAANQFTGGCRVRVRGRVGERDPARHSVLIVAELLLLP